MLYVCKYSATPDYCPAAGLPAGARGAAVCCLPRRGRASGAPAHSSMPHSYCVLAAQACMQQTMMHDARAATTRFIFIYLCVSSSSCSKRFPPLSLLCVCALCCLYIPIAVESIYYIFIYGLCLGLALSVCRLSYHTITINQINKSTSIHRNKETKSPITLAHAQITTNNTVDITYTTRDTIHHTSNARLPP